MLIMTESNGVQTKQYDGKVILHKIPTTLSGDVTIPQRVTHIQITSFTGCSGITSITLQDKVKGIKAGAFKHCKNLEKIIVSQDNKYFESDYKGVLFTKGRDWLVCAPAKLSGLYVVPNGVKHIERDAFKDCAGITTLMLAQTVTSISSGAFENCTGLLHIMIPPNVRKIAPGAFAGCSQLCGVTVASDNENFTSDQDGALFNKDKTELLYVPATLNGQQGVKDGRFIVPEGVTHIAKSAFSGGKGITELILPNTLQSIGRVRCHGLTKVYAPPGVVDWHMFDECENLQKRYIRDPGGLIYDKDTKKIDTVWRNIVCANILNGVEEIEPRTFADRLLLTSVAFPESVTHIGDYAFAGCKSLTEIIVSPKNTALYTDEHGVLFEKIRRNIVLVRVPTNLAGSYCVPEGVTHIASNAFESCMQLTKVKIPESVWSIQQRAFVDCPNLSIYGMAGSNAESAARGGNIPFVAI